LFHFFLWWNGGKIEKAQRQLGTIVRTKLAGSVFCFPDWGEW